MFERILIPLDGSARAEAILGQVGRILHREDSELLFLRVIEPPPVADLEAPAFHLDRDREEAQKYVQAVTQRYAEKGVKAHGQVAEGAPARVILETAQTEGSTLIAMSTHGRTGMSRWLMGSVAEKVSRASEVPVLLLRSFRGTSDVPKEGARAAKTPFRKILVPVDGSPASMEVVAPTEKLALLYGSEILVLHVETPVVLPGMEMGVIPVPLPTPSEEDPATARAVERFRQAGLRVRSHTVVGDPSGQILDESQQPDIDLIAMATHGRSGVSRWVLGSVAERVLRHATAPVLLVRVAAPIAKDLKSKNRKGSLQRKATGVR
jgi:nucleotide-binding universal stress UspA family protein